MKLVPNPLVSRNCLALAVLLLIHGCTYSPIQEPARKPDPRVTDPSDAYPKEQPVEQPDTKTPTQRIGQPVTKPVEIDRERPSAAALQVLAQAEATARSGNYDQALLLLDRAQRISPQAGEVYLQMARVQYDQGSYNRAEQLCLKAIALSGKDPRFKKQSLQTLAIVRDAKGDSAGADAARKQAASL
ncbi:tetratricopeptide repeat protein [Hahella ganghwensis]|uniref:tetratricopeptide repeat protein n=1 Tax=Hahella ganghwensis TaxID=286420 RepID=UPI0003611D6E|nr:tetratricopeptide repeat protein [Hahella ganghwensis]